MNPKEDKAGDEEAFEGNIGGKNQRKERTSSMLEL